jgi:tRNA(adenine34) deaminase
MCAGAALLSRIETIVYGAADPKFGACGSIIDIPAEKRFNHDLKIVSGVLNEEVAMLMKTFFRQVRKKKREVN